LEATGSAQESLVFFDAAAGMQRSVLMHCPAGTKSLPDTLHIAVSSMTSL